MSRDTRIPTSVTRVGRVTVRVYDEEAYQANIKRYYGNEKSFTLNDSEHNVQNVVEQPVETVEEVAEPRLKRTFEKKKPSARYDWATWRGGPMIREGQTA